MRLAVWRYSLAVQVGSDSKAGGGRITEAVLLALKKLGHEVTVFGKLAPGAKQWLADHGFESQHDALDVEIEWFSERFGGALVLTGPTNMLYDARGLIANYGRLCAFGNLAKPVAYAQWDPALPFMFRPELNSGFRNKSDLCWDDVSGLRWTLLSQQKEEVLRSSKNKASAYATTPFRHERCLFESCELDQGEELEPARSFEPKIGYFGSDRPGRIAELKRWSETGVPIVVHGRWSAASKAKLPKVEFRDPVPEQDVRARLNQFAATLHLADASYVKGDFVSQRFFENAMAGVPTFYSDQIQPSIRPYVREFVVDEFMKPLRHLFAWVSSAPHEERCMFVEEHRKAVRRFAARCSYKLEAALGRTFS